MAKRHIKLRGLSGELEGKTWESEALLRAGRLESLEVVLDDSSVSRRHAEVRATDNGWQLRDLGSTNGTFLNGIRLGNGERRVRERDIIQCGKMSLVVEQIEDGEQKEEQASDMMVEAATSSSWEDAIRNLAMDSQALPAARRAAPGPHPRQPSPGSPRQRSTSCCTRF